MATNAIAPWVENVALHPDVVRPDFSEDVFALDLGPLADGNPNVPAVYRDAEQFFRSSYLTAGLRRLLDDVLARLAGQGGGSRVLKLVTPFGGGKSHTLAALYHAAREPKALGAIPEGKSLPRPKDVNVAVFDGQFFDATKGKAIPGTRLHAKTMWGWVAAQLGGRTGYEKLREQDEARVAPGADEILAVLGEAPNLILLDEVLQYLISAGGVRAEQTTLRDETLTFLQRLTTAVGNTPRSALVFTLQSSKRESLEYVSLLQTVDHLAARKDQRREPVEGEEILAVIQRRLLGRVPDQDEATPAAMAYQAIVTKMRSAYAHGQAERQQAEEDGLALRNRVRVAYPFHPALIDVMRERWAAIPDFQRTRGALRFLAACLRTCHAEGKSRVVLGPGDVPLHNAEVRLAFFKEVGQQADFQAVLEHDLVGQNARARRVDDRRAKENSQESVRRPATRLATAILMYSFGGLKREAGSDGEVLPPGVTEADLLAACVGPDLDSTTALACLKELREQCLYLHFDGARYCFKKDPNVTLLLEQEADIVGRDERRIRAKIKELIEDRVAGHRDVVVWPDDGLPDGEPTFIVGYLPLDFAAHPRREQEEAALSLLTGSDGHRAYRNGAALAIPAADQVEGLRRAVRYLLAAEQVKGKARQLNLTDEQRAQLREREATEAASAESSMLKLYAEVWLPKMDKGAIALDKIAVGGRPLATTVNERKQALIHERVTELLTIVHKRVFGTIAPSKIVELFGLGEGPNPAPGIKASEVVDGFFGFLGFPRLTSDHVIEHAIARGVKEGFFGYLVGPSPVLSNDGRYQVPHEKVRFKADLPVDEVDLESGFLLAPAAIPLPPAAVSVDSRRGEAESASTGDGPTLSTGGSGPVATTVQRRVTLRLNADRDSLFGAWAAIANLADLAGQVRITIEAEAAGGFDQSKLRNGVLEPLEEQGLIQED